MSAYFFVCRVLGGLLRSARYSRVRIISENGELLVRKHRSFYAPLLIWMGGLLTRVLNTGVRVLTQREWEDQERRIYQTLYGTSIRVDAGGTVVLPRFAGETLAALLDNPDLQESMRMKAIERAVVALAELHHLGFTHADAMAENVLVDLAAGRCSAHWLDFETIHDARRPMTWRRADDVRALLSTCLVRTTPGKWAETVQLVRDAYGDEEVTRVVAESFASVWRRSLTFHLAQAPLSLRSFREVARLLQWN